MLLCSSRLNAITAEHRCTHLPLCDILSSPSPRNAVPLFDARRGRANHRANVLFSIPSNSHINDAHICFSTLDHRDGPYESLPTSKSDKLRKVFLFILSNRNRNRNLTWVRLTLPSLSLKESAISAAGRLLG